MAHVDRKKIVKIKVTPAEHAVIKLAAYVMAMTMEDYIRELALSQSRIDAGKTTKMLDNLTRERTQKASKKGTV